MRHDVCMDLRPGMTVDDGALADFAARNGVAELALYGSILREDFTPDSDIDILVSFLPGRTPGLLAVAEMELQLELLLGRTVELRTHRDLSRFIRDRILADSRPLYAA